MIYSLTSLRFVAAAMIVLHHSKGVMGLPSDLFSGFVLNQGVSFFFVLSGFILHHVYRGLAGTDGTRRFLVARFARIWPGHVAAIAFFVVAFWPWPLHFFVTDPGYAVNTMLNLVLLQGWVPVREVYYSVNWVAWSLSTEWFFYLCFPLLIKNFETTWLWKLTASALLVVVLLVVVNVAQLGPDDQVAATAVSRAGLLYINPLSRLFEFVVGMCVSLFYFQWRQKVSIGKVAGSLLEATAIVLAVLSVYVSSPIANALSSWVSPGAGTYWASAGSCLAFGFLILVMAFEKGWISQILRIRTAVLLGEISYAVYLFHQLILRVYAENAHSLPAVPDAVLYPIYWIVLIALSYAVWAAIEKPSRRALVTWASGGPMARVGKVARS